MSAKGRGQNEFAKRNRKIPKNMTSEHSSEMQKCHPFAATAFFGELDMNLCGLIVLSLYSVFAF